MLPSTLPLQRLGIAEPDGSGVSCQPPAAAPLKALRHRPRVVWDPPRHPSTVRQVTSGPGRPVATVQVLQLPGSPRNLSAASGAVARLPAATAHASIGSYRSRRELRQPGSPQSWPPPQRGEDQIAAPRTGATHSGAKGELPRPHAAPPPAKTSVPLREDDDPRQTACGRDPRAGRSTHPPPYRRRHPGAPFHPQQGPRRPAPILARGLPPVARPSLG